MVILIHVWLSDLQWTSCMLPHTVMLCAWIFTHYPPDYKEQLAATTTQPCPPYCSPPPDNDLFVEECSKKCSFENIMSTLSYFFALMSTHSLKIALMSTHSYFFVLMSAKKWLCVLRFRSSWVWVHIADFLHSWVHITGKLTSTHSFPRKWNYRHVSVLPFIFVSCSLTIEEVGCHSFPLK